MIALLSCTVIITTLLKITTNQTTANSNDFGKCVSALYIVHSCVIKFVFNYNVHAYLLFHGVICDVFPLDVRGYHNPGHTWQPGFLQKEHLIEIWLLFHLLYQVLHRIIQHLYVILFRNATYELPGKKFIKPYSIIAIA